MTAPTHKAAAASAGFTLIETLAALAIFSALVVSTGVLMHDGVFFFDRGTRAVDQEEQLSLAVDCLTHDFGAARFVLQKSAKGVAAAFTGRPADADNEAQIVFITGGGRARRVPGDEVVSLSVESEDGVTKLVRRRARWNGPQMRFETVQTKDAVVLLSGKFNISFAFSQRDPDGHITWFDRWSGENGLPHSIRMTLVDDTAGSAVEVRAEFPIHADAPPACAIGKAKCLTLAAAGSAANPGGSR